MFHVKHSNATIRRNLKRPKRRTHRDTHKKGARPSQISDLTADPRNARTHDERNIGLISTSLKEVGAARSIVIDEKGVVLAGNGTVAAADGAGIKKLRVIDAEGDELVAVRRKGLTAAQKRRLALLDNRTAELAGWDSEVLAGFQSEGTELGDLWNPGELAAVLDFAMPELTQDEIPPLPKKPKTKLGDLYVLGAHRLLCGDATDPDDVGRVMAGERATLFATDPPYGVNYEGGDHPSTKANRGSRTKNKNWSKTYMMAGDDEASCRKLHEDFMAVAISTAIAPRAAWYCWHASRNQGMVEDAWKKAGALVHQQIIWAKSRGVLTYSTYMWAHEPCLYGWLKGQKPKLAKTRWPEGEYPSTVWAVPSSEVESKDHPTSKPVKLFGIPMRMHTVAGDLCYEPFSGSGSQLIAAEQLGRRCFGLEISPAFCDVIVERWQKLTGAKAKRAA